MRKSLNILLLQFTITAILAQSQVSLIQDQIQPAQVKAHLEFLASDALKGRDTGSAGLEAAAAYIASHFRANGIEEIESSYFQQVPFSTFSPPDSTYLMVAGEELKFPDDFIVINGRKEEMTAPTVFIGYGNQDDIDQADLRSKIAVSTAGDGFSDDPRDWIAHSRAKRKRIKEAGGVALLEIYQSSTIPWRFLRMIGTQSQTALDEGHENTNLPNIWIGTTDSLIITSLRDGKESLTLYMDEVERRQFSSANVVGLIPGSDPELSQEYIVYSAHYDHVGTGRPDKNGDTIYNGARDNAVGTTAVLSLANYFAKHPPKRSSIFALFTAEEKGLLGSRYFTQNLPVPANQIKYNFNIDNGGYNDTTIITVIGLTRTEAEEDIQKACNAFGLTAIEDPAKEQGLFDRSDNVNFAVLGIPAPTFSLGFRAFDAEIFKYYHQPGDEVSSLNLNYVEKYIKSYILSAVHIANRDMAPFWIEGDKYFNSGKELYNK